MITARTLVSPSILFRISASAAAIACAGSLQAQEAVPADEEQVGPGLVDSGIVVTARRRDESLLEVPVPVTVLREEQLRDLGAIDIVDIAELTPGFAMQNNSRQNEQPFIRGMSVNSFFQGSQKASFFHDGVFVGGVARTVGIDDIQQVEVVKGPQAVYFGRQTFAGAINYITKRPTFDWRVHGRAEYAEFDDYQISGGISGPLIGDVLAFRLYGQYGNDDGAFRNTLDDFRVQTEETAGGSASLTFRPSSAIEFTARAQYVEFDDGHNAAFLFRSSNNNCRPNTAGVNQAFCGTIEAPDEVSLNLTELEFPGGARKVTQERYSLIGDIEFGGGWSLNTITAYNKDSNVNSSDGDATPTNAFRFTFETDYDDFTQQLVLTSPQQQPLRFTLGGIYFESERTESSITFPISAPSVPVSVENIGIFGGVEYDFNERLTLGLEARYSSDKVVRVGTDLGNTFEAFLPRVTLDYQVSDDALLYAIVAKGNQPGDFNTNAGVQPEDVVVDEEEIWNYEIGYRQSFMDGRGLVALNAYYIDWDNQVVQDQVPGAPGGPTPLVVININAGETRIWGLEFEGSVELAEGFTLRGTYAYNNAEFTDFISRRPLRFNGDPQVAGNQLQNTPEHMLSLAATYETQVSADWRFFTNGIFTFRSEQFLDETNTAKIGPTEVINAQLGFTNGSFRFTGFVRNLFNEDTPAFGTIFSDFGAGGGFNPAYLLALREPQQFGIRLEFDY